METVAWVCEFCNGASGKPRASENSRRCTSNKKPWNCRDALTEARRREREAQGQQGRMKRARVQLQGQPSAYAAIIAEKNIQERAHRSRPENKAPTDPRDQSLLR